MAIKSYDLNEVETWEDGPRKKFYQLVWIGNNYKALGLESPDDLESHKMSCAQLVEFINKRRAS
jgi:hypothetical protein